MEMVYAKTSRTKLTATEKYESRDNEDVAVMPLAIPMIAGPGAITTTMVTHQRATGMSTVAWLVIFASIGIAIAITYFMMKYADYIISKIGQRQYRVINRLMGILLIAIAVQFVITGIKVAFPLMGGS